MNQSGGGNGGEFPASWNLIQNDFESSFTAACTALLHEYLFKRIKKEKKRKEKKEKMLEN